MGCTVAELGQRLSSEELTEWVAYAQLEPFGAQWDNWRSGMVASTIANVNRAKNSQPYEIEKFMPGWKEKPRQPWQHIRAAFQAAFGAKHG